MRFLVTGSRDWPEGLAIRIREKLEKLPPWTLVQGYAAGADRIAHDIWTSLERDSISCPARWSADGKSAGPRRNARMLIDYGPMELVLAFFKSVGDSKGTKHMVRLAKKSGIKVIAYKLVPNTGTLVNLTDDDWKIILQ